MAECPLCGAAVDGLDMACPLHRTQAMWLLTRLLRASESNPTKKAKKKAKKKRR